MLELQIELGHVLRQPKLLLAHFAPRFEYYYSKLGVCLSKTTSVLFFQFGFVILRIIIFTYTQVAITKLIQFRMVGAWK